MIRWTTAFTVALLALGLAALAGCSSDDSDSDTTNESTDDSENSETPGGEEPSGDLPQFSTEWDQLCTTQVGFPGATEYTSDPGPNVIVYMENYRDEGNYITSSRALPAGWALQEDDDYEDNSEFAAVELVGCLDRTATTPTGIDCEFDDDGTTLTLELVDASYDLTVYAATSADVIGTKSITAAETECPFIVSSEEGDTEYVATPSDDDIVNALKEFVAPS